MQIKNFEIFKSGTVYCENGFFWEFLTHFVGLGWRLLSFFDQFIRSLDLDQSLRFHSLFQSFANEGGNFNDIYVLVVASDIFLYGSKRGAFFVS